MSEIKYGYVRGPRCLIPACIGASEVFKDLGGRFTKFDGNANGDGIPRVSVAGDGDAELAGWLEGGDFTASSTEGQDTGQLDVSCLSIYRLPVNTGTLAVTDVGKTCDISVASNIQGLQADVSTEDTVMIVKRESATVALVRMNPSKIGSVGVV